MAKSLLTKHGKFYELNPYKVIQRLEDTRDKVFDLEENLSDGIEGNMPIDKGKLIDKIYSEIDDLVEQIYDELDLPR